MTGERMETVREALRRAAEWHGRQVRNGVQDSIPEALAEVERWERDRARLEAASEALHLAVEALMMTPTDDESADQMAAWLGRRALCIYAETTGTDPNCTDDRDDPPPSVAYELKAGSSWFAQKVREARAALGEGQDSAA